MLDRADLNQIVDVAVIGAVKFSIATGADRAIIKAASCPQRVAHEVGPDQRPPIQDRRFKGSLCGCVNHQKLSRRLSEPKV